ncbi:FbpB family small basic protein [Mangrovibacillus sp. Mu-81]
MIKKNLQQLIQKNKEQILRDKNAMDRIERKVDLKYIKDEKENV